MFSYILLFSIFVCSCDEDEFSRRGSDTRWQKYTAIRKDPVKEIDLLPPALPILRFAVSADRQRGLYASPSKRRGIWIWAVHLVDLNSGNHLLTLEHPATVQCLSFSPDGQRAISAATDGTVRLWDLSSGKQLGCVKAHTEYAGRVAYSPFDERWLSGGRHGEILLWDMEKKQVIRRFVGHSSGIRASLAWARDGKTFLSGSWDGSVRLWDVQTSEEIAHLQPGYGRVMSLALSPDGKYALSSYLNCPNQPVIYWDLQTEKEINRFGVPGNPWYSDQRLFVASVAFLPDGKTALFGLVFGTVIWWDLNKWELIAMNRLHQKELEFVACSADGKTSISVGIDAKTDRNAKVKFWRLPDRDRIKEKK
jgi:WD40 repeat protein